MNLIRIGGTVLNVDRINGVQDHLLPAEPPEAAHEKVTRAMFDHGQIDLTGEDSKTFRRWYRHLARDIAPHKDEDGEELVSPERQLREVFRCPAQPDRSARPRELLVRGTAHTLSGMMDRYITGEVEPMRHLAVRGRPLGVCADDDATPSGSSSVLIARAEVRPKARGGRLRSRTTDDYNDDRRTGPRPVGAPPDRPADSAPPRIALPGGLPRRCPTRDGTSSPRS